MKFYFKTFHSQHQGHVSAEVTMDTYGGLPEASFVQVSNHTQASLIVVAPHPKTVSEADCAGWLQRNVGVFMSDARIVVVAQRQFEVLGVNVEWYVNADFLTAWAAFLASCTED